MRPCSRWSQAASGHIAAILTDGSDCAATEAVAANTATTAMAISLCCVNRAANVSGPYIVACAVIEIQQPPNTPHPHLKTYHV